MNKNLYRIVFNDKRGLLMAVAEFVRGEGKHAGDRSATGCTPLWATLKPLCFGLLLALGGVICPAAAQIVADPSAASRQQATVLKAANGVPLVNIQTPSAAGVSRNIYSQFDVNGQGAILNNSRANVQTQLGGWVQGNPWLATGSARIILNEVNSSNPSQLSGYVEIAGQRAEVIIANPAGIQVDGGGFLNAGGITLATGQVQLGANGAIDGYRVQGGSIAVNGLGLDSGDADYTHLLARAAQINAGIWANDLKVVLGNNDIANNGGLGAMPTVTPIAAAPGAVQPTLALDVGQLGGMYAGKIFLVGTEAGLGARNAGTLNAATGQVQVSLDGLLSSSGAIAAGQDVSLNVQGLANSGAISSQRDIVIADGGAGSSNSGTLNAARQLQYSGTALDNQSGGTLTAARLDLQAQSLSNAGLIQQTGAQYLNIQAERLANSGPNAVIGAPLASASGGTGGSGNQSSGGTGSEPGTPSEGNSGTTPDTGSGGQDAAPGGVQLLPAGQISAQNITNSGQILANGASDVATTQSLSNSGTLNLRTLSADGSVDNSQGTAMVRNWRGVQTSLLNQGGSLYSTTDLNLQSQRLDNTGGQIGSAGSLTVHADQDIVNAGGVLSGTGDTQVAAQSLDNSQGGTIASNTGSVVLSVAQTLGNQGGDIHTVGTGSSQVVTLQAGALDNTGGAIAQAGSGAMQVNADGALINTQGQLTSQGTLGIHSGALVNDAGVIASQGQANLDVASLSNRGGTLQAGADLSLQSAGAIDNTGGGIGAGGPLSLTAQSLDNTQGQIAQAGAGTMRLRVADTLTNTQGQIASNGGLDLNAGQLDNARGTLSAQVDLNLSVPMLDNTGGALQTGGRLTLSSPGAVLNTDGLLQSGSDLNVSSGSLVNDRGQILSGANAAIDTGALSNAGGVVAAQNALTLATQALNNKGGQIGGESVTLDTHGQNLVNDGGQIVAASGDLLVSGGALSNQDGLLQAGRNLAVNTNGQSLANTQSGTLLAVGDATLTTGALANDGGVIQAGVGDNSASKLNINATGPMSNHAGRIQATGELSARAQNLDSTAGQILAGAALGVTVDGNLNNTGGSLLGDAGVMLASGSLTNDAGGVIGSSGNAVNIDTGVMSNRGGAISAATQTDIGSQALDSSGGQIGGESVHVDTHGQNLTNDGGQIIAASGDLQLSSGSLTNQGGLLQAGRKLDVNTNGQRLTNTQSGTLLSVGDASLDTGALNNDGGVIQAGVSDNATSTLSISAVGPMSNQAGRIQATSELSARAQSLDNTDGQMLAGAALGITVDDALNNTGGALRGDAGVTLASGSLANDDGAIGSSTSAVDIVTGVLSNRGGAISAATQASVGSQALDNTKGQIGGASVSLDTHGQSLANDDGQIIAATDDRQSNSGALDVRSGALSNQGGSLQAADTLNIAANGLDNRDGLIAASSLSVQSRDGGGRWAAIDNRGGTLAADQALVIDSGALDNTQGVIETTQSGSTLTLRSHGQDIVNQQSGDAKGILAAGALAIDAQGGQFDNGHGGYTGAGGNAAIGAARILNAGGAIAGNADLALASTASSGTGIDNSAQGVVQALGNLSLNAGAADIDNAQGTLLADGDLTLANTGAVDNRGGAMRAGQTLAITDPNADGGAATQIVDNSGGQLYGAGQVKLQSGSLAGGTGGISTGGDLTLALTDSFTQASGATLSANGQLTVQTQGDLINQGQIEGGTGVTVSGVNVDNQAGASITSAGATTVNASQNLTNRGLIDGSDTQINAAIVDNAGTGRIYGDHLSIAAGTVHNREEVVDGVLTSATIAARQQLDIGAQVIDNSGGASLLSLGDLNIGGALDAARTATGQAQAINNPASSIQSGGNMTLRALEINNTNPGLVLGAQVLVSSAPGPEMYALLDGPMLDPSLFVNMPSAVYPYLNMLDAFTNGDSSNKQPGQLIDGRIVMPVHPDLFGPDHYIEQAIKPLSCIAYSNLVCTKYGTTYALADSPLWTQFGMTPPEGYDLTPGNPNYAVSLAAVQTLDAAITAQNLENNSVYTARRDYYDYYNITNSTYQDQVVSTTPGRISAGGDLTVDGKLNNTDSSIIVGGTIHIADGDLNNVATQGATTVVTSGTVIQMGWRYGSQTGQTLGSQSNPKPFSTSTVSTTDLPTLTYLQNQSVAAPSVAGNGNTGQNVQTDQAQAGQATVGAGNAAASGNSAGAAAGAAFGTAQGDIGASATAGQASSVQGGIHGEGPTNAPPRVTQYELTSASGDSVNVRTVASGPQLPASSLYSVNPGNPNAPLVETDPAFTRYQQWLGSDYMLAQLGYDPANTLKRLGDGFYESQLIQQQVAQLTGRQFLDGYSDQLSQYQALMDAGVTYAQAWNLTLGVALSAAQMAQLTSDMVWLVSQTVTLPDGSTQTVLVPQLYVLAQSGDLSPGGALISGNNVVVDGGDGNVNNSGTIAGRNVVQISGNDINNVGGRITGNQVSLAATRDINVIGGSVDAAMTLLADAGNDINVSSATRASEIGTAANGASGQNIDQVGRLAVTGKTADPTDSLSGLMSVSAGHDLNLNAAQLQNQAAGGKTELSAGNDLNLGTVTTSSAQAITWNADNWRKTSTQTEVGTVIQGAGDVSLSAGNDLNARAASVTSQGALGASAKNDLNLLAGSSSSNIDAAVKSTSSGFLSSSTSTRAYGNAEANAQGTTLAGASLDLNAGRDLTAQAGTLIALDKANLTAGRDVNLQDAQATSIRDQSGSDSSSLLINSKSTVTTGHAESSISQGTYVTGQDVSVTAGNDINLTGSHVVGQSSATLHADNDINILAGQNTASASSSSQTKKSGLSLNRLSVSLGSSSASTEQQNQSVTAAASSVQAQGEGGNVSISAGGNYTQTGSIVMAGPAAQADAATPSGGNVDITARNITVDEAREVERDQFEQRAKQSGITVGVSGPTINPLKGGSIDPISVSVTLGRSSSQGSGAKDQDTAAGSTINAGGSVNLTATDGDIRVRASNIEAGGDANLAARQGDVVLQATQNTYNQQTSQGSNSLSLGTSYSNSGGNQVASQQQSTVVGSTVSASNVNIAAGRDAQVTASTVVADNDITIQAGRNIDILAAQATQDSSASSSAHGVSYDPTIKLSPRQTLLSVTRGEQNGTGDASSAVTSLLSANGGNLTMVAGLDEQYAGTGQGNVTTEGADLLAAGKVSVSGNAVHLNEVTSSGASAQNAQQSSLVIGSQLTGSVGGVITRAYDMAQQARTTQDSRLQGALALKAGYDAYKLVSGSLEQPAQDGPAGAVVGVSVSAQYSQQKSASADSYSTQRGTNIQAGEIDITARESDLTAQAAKLQAQDINLSAARTLDLEAGANSAQFTSSNSSFGIGGGATLGGGAQNGLSFQANIGASKGKANGVEVVHDNTLVTATGTLSTRSGGDTILNGAQLAGDTVKMNVGGDLKIGTQQDYSAFASEQSSAGLNISVCVLPLCAGQFITATASFAQQSVDHNYQSATGQSGIAAGVGGYDISVQGKTELKGAAITSTASPDQNKLATASLTFSDLDNSQHTASSSEALSLSYGGASSLGDMARSVGQTALGTLAGGVGLPADNDQKSQTLSVISPGQITITGTDAESSANVATLTSRDASTANQALTNTLSLQQAQELPQKLQQARQRQQAADLVGSVLDEAIGDLAQNRWADGSPEKVLLHGLAGVVQAAVGGGNVLAGAAAGMTNEAVLKQMSDYLISQGIQKGSDEYKDLMTAGSSLLGTAVGALAGNANTGANVATNATVNNFLKHDQWQALSDKLAACQQKQGGCSSADEKALRDEYQRISTEQDQQLKAACASLGSSECRSMLSDAQFGTATQQALVLAGSLPEYYWGGSDFNASVNLVQKRVDAYDIMSACAANQQQCDQQRIDGAMQVLMTGTAIVAAPALALEATVVTAGIMTEGAGVYCSTRAQQCLDLINTLAEMATGTPMSGAAGIWAGEIPSGYRAIEMAGLPAGTTAIADAATGEIKLLTDTGKIVDVPPALLAAQGGTAAGDAVATAPRVTNGVALDPRLPDPVAGLEYTPNTLNSPNPNIANSQVNGYVGELNLANDVANLPNQIVVRYGDAIGTHGADVISVNSATGEVTLWDNKFLSNAQGIPSSTTFTPQSSALNGALSDARTAIQGSDLPQAIKDQALQNLQNGNFTTNTVGSGAAKNSTTVRFCGFSPC